MSKNNAISAEKIKKSNTPCQFIVKLLEMMKQYPKNVIWSQNGESICFIDLKILQNQVIPNYFRHRNMLSFVRQLNMYYFSKMETDEENVIKFKHSIFRRGNEANFCKIVRRNKVRDQIINGMQKSNEQTLEILQKQERLSEKIKSLVRVGLQYHLITLKNLKKLKSSIQQISDQFKSVRGKQIKNSVAKLKQQNMQKLNKLIQEGKAFDIFNKQILCRDLNIQIQQVQPSMPSQLILFDEPRTIRQVEINKGFSLQSQYSILNFKSQCSLDKNLKQQQIDRNEQISLQEDLRCQQNQQ